MTTVSVRSCELQLEVLPGPDITVCTNGQGQPFTPQRVTIKVRPNRAPFVWIAGPAILRDGSIGKAERGASYGLMDKGRATEPRCPEWLAYALTDVGVTKVIQSAIAAYTKTKPKEH